MARKPNTLNVPIRVTLSKPGGAVGYWQATAKTRITPLGRFQISCFGTCPVSARKLAQAALLHSIADALFKLASHADRAGATEGKPSSATGVTDREAIDEIEAHLSVEEWSPDTLDSIAATIRKVRS